MPGPEDDEVPAEAFNYALTWADAIPTLMGVRAIVDLLLEADEDRLDEFGRETGRFVQAVLDGISLPEAERREVMGRVGLIVQIFGSYSATMATEAENSDAKALAARSFDRLVETLIN